MTGSPNEGWFRCIPPCEAYLPCGPGRHIVRWEAGQLRLPSHPDPEAELVLAALGGDKARCIEVAQAWKRHAEDWSVLAAGPRGPAGEIAVSWDDVDAAVRAGRGRNDLLSLFALGHGFQVRLIGQVAESACGQPAKTARKIRPSLVAAVTARLAPVAEEWLGLDPGQVVVTLHHGPGWGSAELAGRGEQRRLRVSLPASWLAGVWAAGLALTGRHLVVAVTRAGWPDARVLALRAPGTEPVPLDVHAAAPGPAHAGLDVRPAAADAAHWEI